MIARGYMCWDNNPYDDLTDQCYYRLGEDEPNKIGDVVIYGHDDDGNGVIEGKEFEHIGTVIAVDEEGNTIVVRSKEGGGETVYHHPRHTPYHDPKALGDPNRVSDTREYWRKGRCP